jgi:HPt (histidine-containing phosphotransfer) domain-containing protein
MHSDMGTALVQSQDFPGMMQLCAEAILRGVGTVFSRIWMVDPGTDTLLLCDSAGLYTHLDGPHSRVRIGEMKVGRIAHTVKGVAGNLGIGSIQSAAEKIERALRDGSESAPAMLKEFGATLVPMVQAIQAGLAGTAPANPAPKGRMTFDAEAASAAITRLKALIEASDGGAVEALTAVEEALAGIVDNARLDALRDALSEFDFEGALDKLTEISRQCGLSQE